MNKRAFSLLELVIVLLIIGALTTMAIGQYLDSQKLSKRSIFESNINEIAKALSLYRSNKVLLGTNTVLYPTSLSDPQFKMLFEQEPRNPYTSKPMLTDNSVDSGIQYVSDGTSYKLCVVQRDVDDVNNNGVVEEVLPLSTKTACIGNTQTSVRVTFTRKSVAYTSDGTQVPANQPRFEPGKFGKAILVEAEGTTNYFGSYANTFDSEQVVFEPSGLAAGKTWSDCWDNNEKAYHGGQGVTMYRLYTKNYKLDIGSILSQDTEFTFTWEQKGYLWSVKVFYSTDGVTWSAWNKNTIYTVTKYHECELDYWEGTMQLHLKVDGKNLTSSNPIDYWKRIGFTFKVPAGTRYIRIEFDWYDAHIRYPQGGWVRNFQLEQKPYPTSFIDGTRSRETLTIPTAGVLNPQEGTIEFWVKPIVVANYNNFFSMQTSNGRFLLFFDTHFYRACFDYGATNSGVKSSDNTITANNLHHIVLRWSATTGKQALFVNGVKYEKDLPNGVATSFPATVSIVNNYSAYIDDLRISNRARTDAEILSAYQSGQPLPVDAWTTLKLDFNGDLSTQSGVIP